MSRLDSLACAAAVVVWNNVVLPSSGSGPRGRALAGAALGLAAVGVARGRGYSSSELGLSASTVPAGIGYGALASTIPLAGYTLALHVPSLRSRLAAEEQRVEFAEWVGFQIPIGTVVTEELLFRGVLSALSARRWPARAAHLLHATAFGLWHVRSARLAGESVALTALVTGVSAWVFQWLRQRSGSVLAPAVLHLSINIGGAVAARAAHARLSACRRAVPSTQPN